MQIRVGQDFLTGIMFVLIGLGALWVGADLSLGTPQRPGTGVLPRILSWCLVGTGAMLLIKAVLVGDVATGPWAWRPLLFVTLATVVFGMTVDSLGLVVAMITSLTLCAMGTPETRWPEYFIFLLIMLGIGVGMFISLLGMPIPIWPVRTPEWLKVIIR
jgi:hypothetical protein